MIRIELRPEVESRLAAEAKARGVGLERYVAEVLEESVPGEKRAPSSAAEAVQRIRELRRGNKLDGLDIRGMIHEGHRY